MATASSNTITARTTRAPSHDDYDRMLTQLRENFATHTGPIFTTTASNLWEEYLSALPYRDRQHHNCHTCRRFIEQYGGLVVVDEEGVTQSAIVSREMRAHSPDDALAGNCGIYTGALADVAAAAERAAITGVFLSGAKVLGTPATFDGKRNCMWDHMAVEQSNARRYKCTVLSASQKMAELGEDYQTVLRAVGEFKLETVRTALALAKSEALYRGEKVEGRLEWLLNLYDKRSASGMYKNRREKLTWLAVATAPAGFCHVKSSVVGSLLEDIESGKSLDDCKRAFAQKMNPLQYQRPTAPPSAGNIAQAERIVAEIGSAGALRRRFARLEDLETVWVPAARKLYEKVDPGVFGHLYASLPPLKTAQGATMTWEKFARIVLPTAEKIEAFAPGVGGNFNAFVTAADLNAPPILQWDREDRRNPVSWYTYQGGSPAWQWNLTTSTMGLFVEVTAVSLFPNMWQPGFDHQGKGVLLVMKDCRDSRDSGLSLFPELLKNEYHSVRATIEAFSRRGTLEGREQASACGLAIRSGASTGATRVRVTSHGTVTEYTIDRWD